MLIAISDKFHKFYHILHKILLPNHEILGDHCILIFTMIYLVLTYLEKKGHVKQDSLLQQDGY